MLYKFFLISLIFFHIIGSSVYSNEQISFDVNEIEILEDGNKIVGKNRGIITTDRGITIEEDKFKWPVTDKVTATFGNQAF